jgi:hypothetical protein
MPETSAQLRERALHYRKLASLATDSLLVAVILTMVDELEAHATELDRWRVVK